MELMRTTDTLGYGPGHFDVFESETGNWYWSYRNGDMVSRHKGPYSGRGLALSGIGIQVLHEKTEVRAEIDRIIDGIKDELARLSLQINGDDDPRLARRGREHISALQQL